MDPLADEFRVGLPNDMTAPARARSEIERILTDRSPDVVRDAQLVASELVTNAWRHGGSIRWFAVCEADGTIRIDVADTSDGDPHMIEPSEDGGFGLHIVDELTEHWGVVFDTAGKVVWSVLPAR